MSRISEGPPGAFRPDKTLTERPVTQQHVLPRSSSVTLLLSSSDGRDGAGIAEIESTNWTHKSAFDEVQFIESYYLPVGQNEAIAVEPMRTLGVRVNEPEMNKWLVRSGGQEC